MKYILIMTIYIYESGAAIHSIEFNNYPSALAAGDAWAKNSSSRSFIVVESP